MKRWFSELRYRLLLKLHGFLMSFAKHDIREIGKLCGVGGPGYQYNGNLILGITEFQYDNYVGVLYKTPGRSFKLAVVGKKEFLAGLSILPDGKGEYPLEKFTESTNTDSPKSERVKLYDEDALDPYERLAYMKLVEQLMADWDEALLEEARRNAPPKKIHTRKAAKKTRKKK